MQNYAIWLLSSLGYAAVWMMTIFAVLMWRRVSGAVIAIQFVSTFLAIAQNVSYFFPAGHHFRWFSFDVAFIILYLPMFFCCSRCKSLILSLAYLALMLIAFEEYSYADDGLKIMANHLYYLRMWISIATTFFLAFSIYTERIGKPDKEPYATRAQASRTD